MLVELVFIDLQQAFDTADQEILCEKLQIYGVQQRELSWFKSYLSMRKQFFRVDGVCSGIEHIHSPYKSIAQVDQIHYGR